VARRFKLLPPRTPEHSLQKQINDVLCIEIAPAGKVSPFGVVCVVGGSRTMTGAVCLAARAAYRAGAGLVTIAVPEGILAVVQPQVPDRHPEKVDIDVVAGTPHRAEDLPVGDQLSGMLDHVGEQAELGRREPDLLAGQPGAMVVEIDDEVTMLEPSRAVRVGRRGPPEGRLHPGRQLRKAQRLGDVVVGAELEALDAVDLLAARGEHDHRNGRAGTQPAADVDPIHPGKHQIEYNDIGPPLGRPVKRD
jgi:hypothetical protein